MILKPALQLHFIPCVRPYPATDRCRQGGHQQQQRHQSDIAGDLGHEQGAEQRRATGTAEQGRCPGPYQQLPFQRRQIAEQWSRQQGPQGHGVMHDATRGADGDAQHRGQQTPGQDLKAWTVLAVGHAQDQQLAVVETPSVTGDGRQADHQSSPQGPEQGPGNRPFPLIGRPRQPPSPAAGHPGGAGREHPPQPPGPQGQQQGRRDQVAAPAHQK